MTATIDFEKPLPNLRQGDARTELEVALLIQRDRFREALRLLYNKHSCSCKLCNKVQVLLREW